MKRKSVSNVAVYSNGSICGSRCGSSDSSQRILQPAETEGAADKG